MGRGRRIERRRGWHEEDAAGEGMEGEARGEEEVGVQAVRGEEGVERRGAEETAEGAGDGGDGEKRGEREEGKDALLEVYRERVPRAGGGVGHGRGWIGGMGGPRWCIEERKWKWEKIRGRRERPGSRVGRGC